MRDGDIVAFSATCTHMGGRSAPTPYKLSDHKVSALPVAPDHLRLTRHGMVVSGHATTEPGPR